MILSSQANKMGLYDLLFGNEFEISIEKVELGKYQEIETSRMTITPRPFLIERYGLDERFESKPGRAYFDMHVQAELIPLKSPNIYIPVTGLYKSNEFNPDSLAVERPRLEQRISYINQLIKEEGIVFKKRITGIETPPVAVTLDSPYAKGASKRLPKDLYQRIVDYAKEKGAIMLDAMPHG